MFYYVGIENGKIISKSHLTEVIALPNGYKEVNKELYNSIGSIPCTLIEENGEIISVEYIEPQSEPPKPPTETELLQQENANLLMQSATRELQVQSIQQENASMMLRIAQLEVGASV